MKSLRSRPALLIAAAAIAAAATILALSPRIVLSQEADSTSGGRPRGTGDRALNIGANKTGISIGDSREWTGLRLNFRDTRLRRASGINATIWDPKQGGAGDVTGLAIGLPLTGGRDVHGIQVGGGISATGELVGIGVGLLGLGAGDRIGGIMVGGAWRRDRW
jgi:hypothetical protein